MIATLLLAASHVLGVSPLTGVAEYYGSDELKAEIREPLVRLTYPIERVTEADRAAALQALAGVKTIVVWGKDTGWIWDGAFEGAPDLERIVLRSGVRKIGNRAFADCPRFTTVISECNYRYDFADDAFAGVTNALTLIECASEHGVAEPWGPFARFIKLNRAGRGFERYDRNARGLRFGGPFVSSDWVYTRSDSFHDGEDGFNKAVLELALKPEEVKLFPTEIDGLPVTRRNAKAVPEADAKRIREAELAFERGIAEGDATYRIVDGEAHVIDYSGEKTRENEEIVLPETLGDCPVTELPASCFAGFSGLKRLVLPKGLKAIPDGFCFGCPRLAAVEIPSSVKRIGRAAFYGCPSLDIPKLAEDVEVAEWAFKGRDGGTPDARERYVGADGKVTVEVLGKRKVRVDFFGRTSVLAAEDGSGDLYCSEDGKVRFLISLSRWDGHAELREAGGVGDRVVGVGAWVALSAEKSVWDVPLAPVGPSFSVRFVRPFRERPSLSRHPVRESSIRTDREYMPYGRRYGFDLALNDFVKPNGRGKVADLYVTAETEPKRVTVEAGETTKGFRRAACVKDMNGPIPAFAEEEMSGEPIVITATNAVSWISWRSGWDGYDKPSGDMVYFTARGVPAALNWWLNPREEGCDCTVSVRVNAEIVPPPPPADCDADLVETEDGVAVYYGGWAHPPVAGRAVKDRNAIRRLILDRRVDEIPDGEFCGLANLRQVDFAEGSGSVRIGRRAFADCPALRLITGVRYGREVTVEADSFAGCATDLLRVVVGDGSASALMPTTLGWKREFRTNSRAGYCSRFALEGDFLFGIRHGAARLIRYFGDGETVRLPAVVEDILVREIGEDAFPADGKTRKVLLPDWPVRLPSSENGGPEYVKEAETAKD